MDLNSKAMRHAIGAFILLIAGTWYGCIPDPLSVDDIPVMPTKLVVGSQVIPGQGLAVMVTRSIGALDAGRGSDLEALISQIAVEDAVVTLEHDGMTDTLTYQAFGVYADASGVIEGGKAYVLHVKSPAFGEVTASAIAPYQVPFQTVSAELYLTGYDSLASVTYSLMDPPQRNWYMVNVQKFSAKDELNTYLNPRIFTHLVNDGAFNGKSFEEQFNVIFQDYSEGDSVAVILSSISHEYYQYLSLRNDSRYSLAGFATEPLNFPGNVNGGYGYFNLHVPDVRIFVLE